MPRDSYEVHPVILKAAGDFEALILALPEMELDDKLTYLTREKGKITRSYYEDFIIANCIANVNQLLAYINQSLSKEYDMLKIRAELKDKILEYNALLAPDNLIINKNYVVKVRKTKRLKPDEKPITDLETWDISYYESKSTEDVDAKKEELKDKAQTVIKDIAELEFEVKQIWWKRLSQYINVKKFKEEDAENILKKRYFHSPTSFNTFIVSVCVVDFEDLFALLDNMGIPSRVAPPILMNELYELCKSMNTFLTYENAQKMADDSNQEQPESEGKQAPYRMTGMSSTSTERERKNKKKFKDVPKEDLLRLGENMKVHLIGQSEAVDNLVDSIQRASIGLKDPNKPIGSFLFAGRTGVGKTLATKILADELIKGKDNLVTVDCSEYSADHEYSKLIGAPAGYIGHEQGGHLTNAVAKNPFCVVVFDEVEKASSKVHELMLQILEEGRLTDGRGQTVSFKDVVIIMTSNVGAKEIEGIAKTIGFGEVNKITDEKKDIALNEALKKKFKPEFLNRIDAIINFRTLVKEDYMRIIDIELYKLNDNLKRNETEYKELVLKFDKSVKDYIYKNGIDENYGARPLKRCIEKDISTPLARKILAENVAPSSVISVKATKNEKIKFDVKSKEEACLYITDEYQSQTEECDGKIV
jgi:ATP-dependent Clp protease ATP-binding subunit ClpA